MILSVLLFPARKDDRRRADQSQCTRSADPSARYTVSAEGDSFTLTLQKEEDFAVFSSEKTYAASALSDLPQTAVGGLLLDIE